MHSAKGIAHSAEGIAHSVKDSNLSDFHVSLDLLRTNCSLYALFLFYAMRYALCAMRLFNAMRYAGFQMPGMGFPQYLHLPAFTWVSPTIYPVRWINLFLHFGQKVFSASCPGMFPM